MFKKQEPTTSEKPAEERCVELEQRIAEINAAIAECNERIATVDSPEGLTRLRSQIAFSEMRRRELIEERISLEYARLEQSAAQLNQKLAEQRTVVQQLDKQRKGLEAQLSDAERQLRTQLHLSENLSKEARAPELRLVELRSPNRQDQRTAAEHWADLRRRLEAL